MARSAAKQSQLETALFASLQYFCAKRFDRDALESGRTRVQGLIQGTVGRSTIEVPFAGELQVAEDGTSASSSAPDTEHLVGYLLDQLDESARGVLAGAIAAGLREDPLTPRGSAGAQKRGVLALLKRLRSTVTRPRRGSVVFAVSPETVDA